MSLDQDKNRHYSLRKLNVGLASVLIGISFVNAKGQVVKADSVKNNAKSAINKQIIKPEKQDMQSSILKGTSEPIKQNAKNVDMAGIQEKTPPVQNSVKQVNRSENSNSSLNSNDVSSLNKNTQSAQNDVPRENRAEVTSDQTTQTAITQLQENQQTSSDQNSATKLQQKNLLDDLGKQKTFTQSGDLVEDNSQTQNRQKLDLTKNRQLAKKVLATNLIETNSLATTNGGFDEATWGKLDVTKWQGSIQGDYYQLTNYTGDANHVIVPNEADFEKAGISTSGKQVGVTSSLMHTIFADKATADDATVAFSKTDNKQVKAINADWSNTWDASMRYMDTRLSKFNGTNLDVSNVTNMSMMFASNRISDLSPLANWKVDNVTNMSMMFASNRISDLSPLANWKVDNVHTMEAMFTGNQISDLSPLAGWNTNNVDDMSQMFYGNYISDLSPLANWKVDNVTDMHDMLMNNQISDLSPLAGWNTNNVDDMSQMFYDNYISDLSPLANWKVDNVTNMRMMFTSNQIKDVSPLGKWNVNNVTNMYGMLGSNQISNLSPLANWKVDNVQTMDAMFTGNQISDLSPLAGWNTNNVDDMSQMFYGNYISDLSPLANWKVDNVKDMRWMFDGNSSIQTKTTPANRIINFVYPAGYTGKKRDSVTQTVNVPTKQVKVELTTKESKPSNNILDWVSKTETPEDPDPVYFQDYTVPTVANLVPNISTVTKQEADPNMPLNVIVTYTAAPVTVHFYDADENADKDSDAVKQELDKTVQLSGTYGSNVDLSTVKLPANFVIDDTSSNTFGNTTDAYINLKHQHAKSTTQAPATRTIVVHIPDGTTKTYVQTIGFVNNLDKDLVTNNITNIYTVDASKSNVTVNGTVDSSIGAYCKTGNDDANGTNYKFAAIPLPKIPGYKAKISRIPSGNSAQPAMFLISFVALPSVHPGAQHTPDDTKQDQDVISDTKDLNTSSMQSVSNQPVLVENANNSLQTLNTDTSTWQIENNVADELITPYVVFNSSHELHLPRFDDYNLQIIKRTSNKDNLSFVYLNQNKTFKYAFNIKIENGEYLLSISQIENKRLIPVQQISFNDYHQLIKLIVKLINK